MSTMSSSQNCACKGAAEDLGRRTAVRIFFSSPVRTFFNRTLIWGNSASVTFPCGTARRSLGTKKRWLKAAVGKKFLVRSGSKDHQHQLWFFSVVCILLPYETFCGSGSNLSCIMNVLIDERFIFVLSSKVRQPAASGKTLNTAAVV